MASSFITPSKRISYHHRIYGRGEICFMKGHSILVKFDNPHEDLYINPLQGRKGNVKKYKWFTNTNANLNVTVNSVKSIEKGNSKSSMEKSEINDLNEVQLAINLLKKEGYKIFKMVEI